MSRYEEVKSRIWREGPKPSEKGKGKATFFCQLAGKQGRKRCLVGLVSPNHTANLSGHVLGCVSARCCEKRLCSQYFVMFRDNHLQNDPWAVKLKKLSRKKLVFSCPRKKNGIARALHASCPKNEGRREGRQGRPRSTPRGPAARARRPGLPVRSGPPARTPRMGRHG